MSHNTRAHLIRNKTTGHDSLVDAILSEQDTEEKALYVKALAINKSSLKRTYVEACLLASSDFSKIGGILELDPKLVHLYSQVFYDVFGLDKLSKMELLDVKDREELMMKVWTLSQGLEFVEWRLGGVTNVNPVDGLKELFSMAMWKARESLFSGNATAESQEGLKWSKISTDLARLLKVYSSDSETAKKELYMALTEVVPNFRGIADLEQPASQP
jgi:hypothetical protein